MIDAWAHALYARIPPPLQSLALTAVGAALRWERQGGEFPAMLAEARAAAFATPEESRAIRERHWAKRMRSAVAEVEAYGHAELGLDEVARLPVLTKAEVRRGLRRFVRPGVAPWRRVRMHTSGTTGAGLQFSMSRFAVRRNYAHVWRYWEAHGIGREEPCGVFGGRPVVAPGRREPPFWVANRVARSVHFSQYHLTPERARLYLQEIRARGLRWLHGYPSVLALLASMGIDAGLAGRTEVRWVTLSSENLLESQRRAIVRMFGVQPRQHYGLAEGVALVCECPEGRLHVDDDYSLVEFLPAPGLPGTFRLVGTSVDNDAFPLLRYEVGDLFRLGEGPCPCGRHGRVVCSIDGRNEDLLTLSDGSRVGRAGFFRDATRVAEAQILQERVGEATLRIVPALGYGAEDEAGIRAAIRERVGERLAVRFDYVEALPRTRGGKLRLVVSSLAGAGPASSGGG